ncbi:circularly permuted type 2 ATP-grasp protein [Tianweitania sp. BSSL-BM11]|uniref:Circularly permuted type 2 ATP-grasp protein n=1 Tax=Tianweitania aestuarii TaxID=2814886 RepID=A0ABS5RXH9_9HYPH|nr:circularly permuted type 2 ATP-grasp protein [Tianweitania aestuarii]MBS9721765.1 circularly permuted type 2 ATP-grasp protein [Tianweitania aestuarii]
MTTPTSRSSPRSGLARAYRPFPDVFDEMMAADGSVRPAWQPLMTALNGLEPDEISRRFARADRYLSDAGVFYRLYNEGGASERQWPLSHLPLILDEAEWQAIATGLIQRAELLEALCADIYGDNRMVAEGLLPPDLVANNPEWLRPMVGHRPAGGHFLHFVGFELGRDRNGRWRVLGDRTQAPSGAGFALENRVAITRAFGDTHSAMNVHRLAGFFRDFREHLAGLRRSGDEAIAIITPGPLNDTYFEHAYIARYLGFPLLEGEDLAVVDGKITVRTVSGLKPLGVLWRRLDAAFTDPLEFRADSRIGTPGLAGALRDGQAAMVNALGSGILETRALLAFLPALAERLVGETLKIPNIATWWCGQQAEAGIVQERFDDLLIGPAFATGLPVEDGITKRGSVMTPSARQAALRDLSEGNGSRIVGQEAIALSTMPVNLRSRLVPRPVILRVYAARTADGWTIMPGGLARIAQTTDPQAIAMQRGGRVADVWVTSPKPVDQVTLMSREGDEVVRTPQGLLPSRTADNLFWLGRYVERAEDTVRILRAYNSRLAERPDDRSGLLAMTATYLGRLGTDPTRGIPVALVHAIDDVQQTAARVRDRFSPDGWLALRDLSKAVGQFAPKIQPGDDAARAMTVILRKLTGFSGLVHENMVRFTGWRFLEIGRRLERAIQMARLIDSFADTDAPDGALDMLLEIGDSVITHRRRYSMTFRALSHIDLLALDPLNPRSILFQLAELKTQIELLPLRGETPARAPLRLEALRLHTALAVRDPASIDRAVLDTLRDDLAGLSNQLTSTYFR